MKHNESRVSTLDLVQQAGFTLLVDPGYADRWRAALADTALPVSIQAVESVDLGANNWNRLREVGAGGAILVRPDRHVAWRCQTMPADPREEVIAAFCALLDRSPVTK